MNEVDIGASGAMDAGPQSKICSKGRIKSDSEYILSELRLSIVIGGTYSRLLYPVRDKIKRNSMGRDLVSYIWKLKKRCEDLEYCVLEIWFLELKSWNQQTKKDL